MESLASGGRQTVAAVVAGSADHTDLPSGSSSTVCAHNPDPDPAPPQSIHPPRCRSLTLGNGVVLQFTEEDIPTPPAISFAENLTLLNQMWDDTPPHWQGHSALIIRGIPIPIVYWRKIYSRLHGEWKGLKSNWSLWKASLSPCAQFIPDSHYLSQMIVARWRQGSEADFWKVFSDDNGNRMTYTAIVKALKSDRVKSDEDTAAIAKREYGSEFGEVFVYRKNGAVHVKTKPSDIAKQYRKLKSLPEMESD
jgi:hypothetical protein